MSPPAMLTGALALTVFWSAFAPDSAACSVTALCPDSWAWPEPPQPSWQLEPPAVWGCVLLWVVPAWLPAPLCAPLVAVWVAVLAPPETSPPATLTGTLALTAFWSALAPDTAPCSVPDFWSETWAWPEPPQPRWQPELGSVCVWVLLWLVLDELPAPL